MDENNIGFFGKYLYVPTICRPASDGSPVTFSKFEEKKNTEKGRRINTVRRLFWGTPSPPQKRPGNAFYLINTYAHDKLLFLTC